VHWTIASTGWLWRGLVSLTTEWKVSSLCPRVPAPVRCIAIEPLHTSACAPCTWSGTWKCSSSRWPEGSKRLTWTGRSWCRPVYALAGAIHPSRWINERETGHSNSGVSHQGPCIRCTHIVHLIACDEKSARAISGCLFRRLKVKENADDAV